MNLCVDSLKSKQRIFQFGNGGSNPTSTHKLKLRIGKFSDFSHLLDRYHYKGKNIGGNIEYNLILRYGNRIMGGAVLGKMRHNSSYPPNSIEIRRLVLHPDCPKNTASYFLSRIMKWLKKNTEINHVYSFADTTVGHSGTIYKASNFKFIRKTPSSKYVMWNDKRYHTRSLSIDRPYSYRLRLAVKNGTAKIMKGKPKLLFKYDIRR